MLQYLSGPRRKAPGKQAPTKAAIKNRVVKTLIKNSPPALIVKAVKRAPLVKAAAQRQQVIKKIEQKSPVTAARIKKAAIMKHRQNVFTKAGNPPMLPASEPAAVPIPEMETPEQVDNYMTEIEQTPEPEQEYIFSDTEPEESDEGQDFAMMEGIYFPGVQVSGKKAAKKRAEKKASKPANVRKDLKAQSKAEARIKRAEKPRGEVVKKLIDTGAKILDKTIAKGSGEAASQQSTDQAPEKGNFFDSIPMPVKILGGVGLAAIIYKSFAPKQATT